MAFLKQANAMVVHPRVSGRGWNRTRRIASSGASSRNLTDQAREILGGSLDPDQYLFTHCFPAGHMVLMGDGTEKPIEDVVVGDLVVTHKGNVKPVTTLLRKQVDEDLVVIKGASVPEVSCTGEHPFYIIRESDAWCRVFPSYQGQVKCTYGGKQVCEKHSCLTNGATPDWVDARDVRVGDRTYTPTLHRTEVPEDINPNRMRLLGYYVAEGRVDKDHNGRLHSVRFSIHEDEVSTLGAEIAGLMRMEFGIPSYSIIQDKKRDTKCVTLSFCSHEHAPWFTRHAGCGSRTKKLSPEVVWAPVEWQRQLVGSWMNGDGCYDGQNKSTGNNGIRLSTSSDDLASQAVVLLDRMGIHSRLQRVKTAGREYKGRWIKGTDGWHVEVPSTYLPKVADVVGWDVEGTARNRLTTRRRYRYAASTLSTVEEVGNRHFKGTVYNLSVQDDESYIVNRQAVHNCTIVASVDTEAPPDVKLGKIREASSTRTIDRRYADYQIKPECSQYVNNNGDSWSRNVLLASYPTFIGAHNFLEHVQVEEKSKGRIIDAVARDIGDSVYIDILVATNRKHASLVRDIESGKMGTLSMGCFLPGTMVSMADGRRIPIEEIQPGDMVLTHKGRARPVANVQIRRRPWSMRRIQAVGVPEEIVTTSTHPFFVYRAPETCACGCDEPLPKLAGKQTLRSMTRRFKTGHDKRIFNPQAKYATEEEAERKARLKSIQKMDLEEVEAGELKPFDFLVFPRSRFDDSVDPGVSIERAKLLGYFLAEGSFLKYKGERTEVEFSFSYDERETYAAEVMRLLAKEFPEAEAPRLYATEGEGRHEAIVRLHNREAASWFYEHGGEYSHLKTLKAEVLRWPEEHQKALIAGWVNGDGWLSGEGHTGGITTSYDLTCQLHLIAARVGAFCTVFSSAETAEGLQIVNGETIPVRQGDGKLPHYTLSFGQTQAQVFRNYSDKVISDPHFQSQGLRVNDDYVMFPITSIESEPYNGFVYDLEVEEDHSYVVEGVAVHNCTTDFTICTKCGHYAVDETELCDHIRHAKLNTFLDDRGQKRVIAELCGHIDYDENPDAPGGVRFIEASWVGVPAFPGAVMRNIMDAPDGTGKSESEIRAILASPPQFWSDAAMAKAASLHSKVSFDFGAEDNAEEEAPADKGDTAPFKDLEDALYDRVTKKVRERIEREMREQQSEEAIEQLPASDAPNDTVIKEGFANPARNQPRTVSSSQKKQAAERYASALSTLVRVAASDVALVEGIASTNIAYGVRVPRDVYRAALRVGAIHKHASPEAYVRACRKAAGRKLSTVEFRVVVRVGTLLSRWESINNPPLNP
jgi:intein/homing endonuclease